MRVNGLKIDRPSKYLFIILPANVLVRRTNVKIVIIKHNLGTNGDQNAIILKRKCLSFSGTEERETRHEYNDELISGENGCTNTFENMYGLSKLILSRALIGAK